MIKYLSIFLFFSTQAFASGPNLTCTLSSGDVSGTLSVPIAFDGEYIEGWLEGGVKDLSFSIDGECYEGSCSIGVVIDSQIAEDEVGSTGFDFEPGEKEIVLVDEALTGAPDGEDYHFSCKYSPN